MKMATRKPTRKIAHRTKEDILTGETFDAMTDEQRAKVFAELESETPEQRKSRSRPLNAEERAWWKKTQTKLKAGRPKFGRNGTRIVSVTVEKSLLKHADAYAKSKGMKRSELFAISLAEKIGEHRRQRGLAG
jgi:hypothetical protein